MFLGIWLTLYSYAFVYIIFLCIASREKKQCTLFSTAFQNAATCLIPCLSAALRAAGVSTSLWRQPFS
jgi:hypothetical protein